MVTLTMVIELLEQAFAATSHLPDAEQDAVAARLLKDNESEAKWDAAFAASPDALAALTRRAVKISKPAAPRHFHTDEISSTCLGKHAAMPRSNVVTRPEWFLANSTRYASVVCLWPVTRDQLDAAPTAIGTSDQNE